MDQATQIGGEATHVVGCARSFDAPKALVEWLYAHRGTTILGTAVNKSQFLNGLFRHPIGDEHFR